MPTFKATSRYVRTETGVYVDSDGREIAYLRRRFSPQGEDLTLLAVVSIEQGDRLDLVAYRTLGDPEQFWRICDANNATDPFALEERVGRRLRIPIPEA